MSDQLHCKHEIFDHKPLCEQFRLTKETATPVEELSPEELAAAAPTAFVTVIAMSVFVFLVNHPAYRARICTGCVTRLRALVSGT